MYIGTGQNTGIQGNLKNHAHIEEEGTINLAQTGSPAVFNGVIVCRHLFFYFSTRYIAYSKTTFVFLLCTANYQRKPELH